MKPRRTSRLCLSAETLTILDPPACRPARGGEEPTETGLLCPTTFPPEPPATTATVVSRNFTRCHDCMQQPVAQDLTTGPRGR